MKHLIVPLVLFLALPALAQSTPGVPRSTPAPAAKAVPRRTAAVPVIETAEALQARLDAATGPQTITIGAGTHLMDRPVFRHRSDQTIRGVSQGETIVATSGPFPWLVTGVSPAAADGFVIGRGARPDAYGVLDATVAPGPGRVWGFDTQERSIPYLVGHGLNLGRFVNGGWDYWSTVSSFTLRVCIGPNATRRLPNGGAVLGVGGMLENNVPAPFCFGFLADSSPGHGTAFLATRWQGDAPGSVRIKSFDYGDPARPTALPSAPRTGRSSLSSTAPRDVRGERPGRGRDQGQDAGAVNRRPPVPDRHPVRDQLRGRGDRGARFCALRAGDVRGR